MRRDTPNDPKGLVFESFRIEGITLEECRSIFVDWALSLQGEDPKAAISELLKTHKADPDDHPMKAVLREGLQAAPVARRRGGRAARVQGDVQ